jgi:osmoprotectant transport system permease protein
MPSRLDKLGAVIAALLVLATVSPLAVFRANRIAAGQGRAVFEALPVAAGVGLIVLLATAAGIALLSRSPRLRLWAGAVTLAVLVLAVGLAGTWLRSGATAYVRVAPGAGFWIGVFALSILMADAIVKLRFTPWQRLLALAASVLAVTLVLVSGSWDDLSILMEYRNRADVFWREAASHLDLALGSLAAAVAIGLPLGILAYRIRAIRGAILNVLNIVQTIPSMAMFGILIGPLGWVAAHVPGATALGIRGIGAAPAFVALFLYALLPVVANTVVGLSQVPFAVLDAATGMGLTRRQRLVWVDLPLALPVILTGIRIVLVQNIGLTTIAALIGGGGFGVFLFQGLGQTATDLILLGALPTVALAFIAAVFLDAVIELSSGAPA